MTRTLFLDYRIESDLGAVRPRPDIYRAEVQAGEVVADPNLDAIPSGETSGRHVLFATHGFNVDRRSGVASLSALERHLALGDSFLFIGVLWPGNWHLPVVNYPKEGDDASACGKRLAEFARTGLKGAVSIRFLSHSLGGRVVLEAIKGLKDHDRAIPRVCLAAPAVDRRCLSPGAVYDQARTRAGRTTVLASKADEALGILYAAGSFAAKVLGDDHPFGVALGRDGPDMDPLAGVGAVRFANNRHGDYFPDGPGQASAKELASMQAMIEALTDDLPGY